MNKKFHKCPLCGYDFEGNPISCMQCTLIGKCSNLRCPNCGYEFPV